MLSSDFLVDFQYLKLYEILYFPDEIKQKRRGKYVKSAFILTFTFSEIIESQTPLSAVKGILIWVDLYKNIVPQGFQVN
jgi:hypothetical protein